MQLCIGSAAQIIFPESGRGLGYVTPTIFGSTVGYPSDSLASCYMRYRQSWPPPSVCLHRTTATKRWPYRRTYDEALRVALICRITFQFTNESVCHGETVAGVYVCASEGCVSVSVVLFVIHTKIALLVLYCVPVNPLRVPLKHRRACMYSTHLWRRWSSLVDAVLWIVRCDASWSERAVLWSREPHRRRTGRRDYCRLTSCSSCSSSRRISDRYCWHLSSSSCRVSHTLYNIAACNELLAATRWY